MARSRDRRDFTHQKLEELSTPQHHAAHDKLFFDRMAIHFDKVTFSSHPQMPTLNAEAPQGHMVLITGPHGSGKSSLIRCLTDNLHPSEGRLVYPAHLRCLQVNSTEPQILIYMTLLQNLTFGSPDADLDRVRRICERVGLGKDSMDELDKNLEKKNMEGDQSGGEESGEEGEEEEEDDGGSDAYFKRMTASERKRVHI